MANPTLHSDILKDDGAIDAAIAKLEKFGKTGVEVLADVKKAAAEMEKELVGVNSATGSSREEIQKTATATGKLEKEYIALQNALSESNKKLAVLREGKKKANQIARAEAKLVLATEDSYNALSAKYSLIKLRLNDMSKAQRENTKEGRELVKESKEIREEMNRLQAETGNTALNVGNYTESIKEALEGMNDFPGAAGSVIGGAKGILRQFKAILRSPIGAVLGLITGALVALTGGFLKSEKGAKLMEKATAKLNAVMSTLTVIATDIVSGFEKIFDGGIQKGFENIGNSILGFGKKVGKGLGALVRGDMATVANTAAEIWQPVGEAIEKVSDTVDELAMKYEALAVSTRKRRGANVRLTKSLGAVQKAEAAAQVTANDTTKSFKQQLAALDLLEAAQKKRLEIQIQIARNSLSTITQEVNIRKRAGEDVIDLLERQAAAVSEVQSLESEYTVSVLEGEKLRREIRRDEFERSLDFAIDFYDSQKTILERIANDESNTFEERRAALSRSVELDKSAFAEQQKLLEDFTGEKLRLNELALLDDERIVRERLEQYDLDDVTLGRILEALRDRKAAVQDILDIEKSLTEERNKQNSVPELLDPINFGDKAEEEAAKRVGDLATNALKKGQAAFREEVEKNKIPEDIYDVLGIDFGNGGEQLKGALDFAKEQLIEFANVRTQIADRAVTDADREVNAAQSALDQQVALKAAGSASNIQSAEEELQRAKEVQEKALSEQKKAQRAEQRLQTIQQATNLVTATSKIWAQLGFPLAVPATAVLWGSFISSKVRAAQLTKKTNRKGTYLDLDWGGSHESGNDIPFGVSKDGKQVLTAEKGESMAVFTSKARQKYGSFLPQMVKAMNRGELETTFAAASGEGIKAGPTNVNVQTDNRNVERYLKKIASNSEGEKTYIDANGHLVRQYKNQKTRVRRN